MSLRTGHAGALSVSAACLLALTTVYLPNHHLPAPMAGTALWKWSPQMIQVDAGSLEGSAMACVSPNGEFVVHCRSGVVQTSLVDPCKSEHFRILQKDDGGDSGLGDIIHLAAVYVCGMKFWWLDDAGEPRI